MEKIRLYEDLLRLTAQQLRPGVLTNAPSLGEDWRREIAAGRLYAHQWQGGLLLLRSRRGYQRLNFYLQSGAAPPDWRPETVTVLETAFREKDKALAGTLSLWRGLGFEPLFGRQRMARPGGSAAQAGNPDFPARTARPADAPALAALMEACFHPSAGCLPAEDELAQALTAGDILCVDGPEGNAAGLLHMARKKNATELRRLAVRADLRGQRVAQGLFAAYIQRTGAQKSLVWVRRDNKIALGFYKKNGYSPDGWISEVLLWDKDKIK